MPNNLRTWLRDKCLPTSDHKDRGARFWTAVQIQSLTWFVVESCEKRGEDMKRWVALGQTLEGADDCGLRPDYPRRFASFGGIAK